MTSAVVQRLVACTYSHMPTTWPAQVVQARSTTQQERPSVRSCREGSDGTQVVMRHSSSDNGGRVGLIAAQSFAVHA